LVDRVACCDVTAAAAQRLPLRAAAVCIIAAAVAVIIGITAVGAAVMVTVTVTALAFRSSSVAAVEYRQYDACSRTATTEVM
jgi:CheY-specific phosphatase CheX